MRKVILIGPMSNRKEPWKTGGVIVLFEQLITDFKSYGIDFFIIDSNISNYSGKLKAICNIIFRLLKNVRRYDHISLHGTAFSFLYLGPPALVIAKLFGKKLSLRKFAGNFNEFYEKSNLVSRYLIKTVISHADCTYFETKYLVDYFRKWNPHTYWFPNVRRQTIIPDSPRCFNKRFVFISHVLKSKGVDEILETSRHLDESYTLDIYGPILNNEYTPDDFLNYKVAYKGNLTYADVIPTLNCYDILLLPSYQEGYPGIVIEAFSLGIPIIATNLPSIMEMCEHGKEGLLIDKSNADQLTSAVKYFNNNNYPEFSKNALAKFKEFNSENHTREFLLRMDQI